MFPAIVAASGRVWSSRPAGRNPSGDNQDHSARSLSVSCEQSDAAYCA